MAAGRSDQVVRVLGRRAAVWRAEVVPSGRRRGVPRLSGLTTSPTHLESAKTEVRRPRYVRKSKWRYRVKMEVLGAVRVKFLVTYYLTTGVTVTTKHNTGTINET